MMAKRRELTAEQRVELMIVALDLCPECAVKFTLYCQQHGKDPLQMIREIFWKWFGQWEHGEGCPKEGNGERRPDPRAQAVRA